MDKLTLVMPAYNEQECIEAVVRAWHRVLSQLENTNTTMIVVNDGSKDETGAILDKIALDLDNLNVVHQENGGHGAALMNAYHRGLARADDGWIFHVDSDNQFEPEDFRKLWRRRENSEFILGCRQNRQDPLHRKIISFVLKCFLWVLTGLRLVDANVPFRLIKTAYLRKLLKRFPNDVFAPNIFLSVLAAHDRQTLFNIPVSHTERQTGKISIVRWGLIKACLRTARELLQFFKTLPRKRGLLGAIYNPWFILGSIALLVFSIPSLYQTLSFQHAWHDVGLNFNTFLNLFDLGYFYSYDWNQDIFNIYLSLIYYPLAFAVKLFPSVIWFNQIHVFALVGAAIFVFKLARLVTESDLFAGVLFVAFLVNPYTHAINLYPHYEVFGLTFLIAFAYFYKSGNHLSALFCFAFALTVKQDFWIYGLIASFILSDWRSRRWNMVYVGTALMYFALVINGYWPQAYPEKINRITHLWSYGQNEGEIVKYLLTHPWESWSKVFTGSGLAFQLSLGFLLILAPIRYLGVLAVLYLWVNATAIDRSSLAYFYALPSLTLSFIVLPFAFRNLSQFFERLHSSPNRIWFAATLLTACFLSQIKLPEGLKRSPNLAGVFSQPLNRRDLSIHRTLSKLPGKDRSIYAQFPIAAYLPKHKDIFVSHKHASDLIGGNIKPDYIVLDLKRWDHSKVAPGEVNHFVHNSPEYKQIHFKDHFYIYQRR